MPAGRLKHIVESVSGITQTAIIIVRPQDYSGDYLRNGSSIDMNVDGSSIPVKFKFTVPVNKLFVFSRNNILLVDSTVKPLEFGGISALTNGLLFQILDTDGTTELKDLVHGEPVTTNAHFGPLAGGDVKIEKATGGALEAAYIRWSIFKSGASIGLFPGEIIQATVQDDLTSLDDFHMLVDGYLMDYN